MTQQIYMYLQNNEYHVFFNFVPEKPVRTIKCPVEREAYKFTNHLSVLSIIYRLSAKSPILSNLILDSVALLKDWYGSYLI